MSQSNEVLKPSSKYVFNKHPEKKTRYVLVSKEGQEIPNFPATWKMGADKGKQYIGFRETQQKPTHGKRWFAYTLELANNKTFTGFNFSELKPNMAYGDDRNLGLDDCVVIVFSEDRETLTLWFFHGKAIDSKGVFERWLNGDIPEVVGVPILPIKKVTDRTTNSVSDPRVNC